MRASSVESNWGVKQWVRGLGEGVGPAWDPNKWSACVLIYLQDVTHPQVGVEIFLNFVRYKCKQKHACRAKKMSDSKEKKILSGLVFLKYPEYVSLTCCSITPKLSLVSVNVCVLFCWAPAEILLLFLPPKPRADSLSKQAIQLPTDGETAFRTDAVGLLVIVLCGMPANKVSVFGTWISGKWKAVTDYNASFHSSALSTIIFVTCFKFTASAHFHAVPTSVNAERVINQLYSDPGGFVCWSKSWDGADGRTAAWWWTRGPHLNSGWLPCIYKALINSWGTLAPSSAPQGVAMFCSLFCQMQWGACFWSSNHTSICSGFIYWLYSNR